MSIVTDIITGKVYDIERQKMKSYFTGDNTAEEIGRKVLKAIGDIKPGHGKVTVGTCCTSNNHPSSITILFNLAKCIQDNKEAKAYKIGKRVLGLLNKGESLGRMGTRPPQDKSKLRHLVFAVRPAPKHTIRFDDGEPIEISDESFQNMRQELVRKGDQQ